MESGVTTITIGGISISFRFKNKSMERLIKRRFAGYTARSPRNPLVISCAFTRKNVSTRRRVRLADDGENGWRATRNDFYCHWRNKTGCAILWPSVYSFDALLRVICATQLVSHNGMLLHASSVVLGKKAILFAGPSGSGKTTVAGLCDPCSVLNDEIVALSISPRNKVRVSDTPFWGEMGTGPVRRNSYDLTSILFLNKSPFTRRVPISKTNAIAKLLRCVCLFGASNREIRQALEICATVLDAVQSIDFFFEKKPHSWHYLVNN